MSAPSAPLSTPEGPGSVSGAPNLPAGFTDTFTRRYIDTGALRQHVVIGGEGPPLLLAQAPTAHEMLGGVSHSRGQIVVNVAGGNSRGGDERVDWSVGGILGCAWRISVGGTERLRRHAMTKVLIA
jgi:hypothetical protein